MNTTSAGAFAPRPADRNAVAIFVGIVWIGMLSGFGTDSFDHIQHHGLDYPVVVHIHAVVFVAWLVLFTAQMLLVRASRVDLHRKLGVVVACLALVMLVLGPVTALSVSALHYRLHGTSPAFLAVQLTTILAFAGLTAAALLSRGTPSAHKRLMLLALAALGPPGFARFLGPLVAAHIHLAFAPALVPVYIWTDLLILGMGVYDLVTRRRLHPAYIAGALGYLSMEGLALALLPSPAWKAFSLHLIGH